MCASESTGSSRPHTTRRLRRAWLLAACVTLAGVPTAGALAPPAQALYGPAAGGFGAELVSVDNASDEQSNAPTTDADISGDGQYVVFETNATNFFENDGETQQEREAAEPEGTLPGGGTYRTLREGGIFRYDRATGQLQIVASGNLVMVEECKQRHAECRETKKVLVHGAQNPSVSAEGRYAVFSSAQQLVPSAQPDKTENVEIYERDMEKAPGQAGAYTLVSAQNGSEEAPKYDNSSIKGNPGGDPGAQLWPNTAISAEGRYVLFRTEEVKSSLPEGSTPETEPGQLFVRDLWDKTTTLVTRTMVGEQPAGGAEGPATLSADGSTVAWVGGNAEAQTVFLPGEAEDKQTLYYLWRRWQEPHTKTRRVTGIADPEDPECHESEGVTNNPLAEGPCYGPLSYQEESKASIDVQAPSLSADGYTVAFLTGSAMRPNDTKPDALDIFLTSMRPGVTRKAGTSELTLAAGNVQGNGSASITSLALSSDGTHIAFVSQRNVFTLPEPEVVGSLSATGLETELYVMDLTTDTLERAVLGGDDDEPNGSTANNPTLTENGSAVAFVSAASNLTVGDANGFPNAFIATFEEPTGTGAPPEGFNSVEEGFSLSGGAVPELGLQVKRGRDGGLDLLVETPGAGSLSAKATGTIATKAGRKTRKQRVVLARASGSVRAEGTTTLVLNLAAKYAKQLKRAGRLKAAITVDYKPPAPAEALSAEASAAFVSSTASKAAKRAAKGRAKK